MNLRFTGESEVGFVKKFQAAEYYREMSEIYMKYNYMIEAMTTETHTLEPEPLQRAMYFVAGCPFALGPLRSIEEFFNLDPCIKFNCKRSLMPKVVNNIKNGLGGEKQAEEVIS